MVAEPLAVSSVLSDRDGLVKYFRAKEIFIPDLKPIFRDWPGMCGDDICPLDQVDQLREAVTARLEEQGAVKRLNHLLEADFASFTALWWPRAPLARQCLLAYLIIWLFTWDDEIDDPDGSITDDFEESQQYREDTERYLEYALGLCTEIPEIKTGRSSIVKSFYDVGVAFCATYSREQRQRFFLEVSFFMRMSQKEQALRLLGRVPAILEYWEYRMGTSAVFIGLAAAEYATQCALPTAIMESSAMRMVWDETNMVISLTNDLISLRKEINKGCIESAVPLTCATGVNIAEAVSSVVIQLQASKTLFDRAAEQLIHEARGDSLEIRENVTRFIEVCRTNCTGNLLWSLTTPRYGLVNVPTSKTAGGHLFRVSSDG